MSTHDTGDTVIESDKQNVKFQKRMTCLNN